MSSLTVVWRKSGPDLEIYLRSDGSITVEHFASGDGYYLHPDEVGSLLRSYNRESSGDNQ